jgi:hypothetical protein
MQCSRARLGFGQCQAGFYGNNLFALSLPIKASCAKARSGGIRSLCEFAGNDLSAVCDEWKSSAGATWQYTHLDFRSRLSRINQR